MKLKRISIFLIFLLSAFINTSCSNAPQQPLVPPKYQITLNFPAGQEWTLTKSEAYTKTYTHIIEADPEPQTLVFSFEPGVNSSFQEFTDKLRDKLFSSLCQNINMNMLERTKDFFIFSVTEFDCKYNNPKEYLYKVFNKDDGQYAIIFTVSQTSSQLPSVLDMVTAVKNATIVPH